MSNLIQMKSKKKQFGINLSFTIECGETKEEAMQAQVYLERFNEAVRDLRLQGFERLTATVTSRQEYLP